MKIYLAGPISGVSRDEIISRYTRKIKYLSEIGYEVLCPMTGKTYLRNKLELRAIDGAFPVATNHAIFERDKWMVNNSDIVLVDLSNSGDRVSIGTVMELAWASMLGKHTVVILPTENVHRHAFVLEAGDVIVETLSEAEEYLRSLIQNSY